MPIESGASGEPSGDVAVAGGWSLRPRCSACGQPLPELRLCVCGCPQVSHDIRRDGSRGACGVRWGPALTGDGCRVFTLALTLRGAEGEGSKAEPSGGNPTGERLVP